jgi:predicted 3-demethylubiquinone-9 3-methyltransferase (glyoxalase superfamily)
MKNKIYPCIWLHEDAKEAALFYCRVFPETTIIDENPFVVVIQSAGHNFMLLNRGPKLRGNPAISFFVHCTAGAEVDALWEALGEGGKILMPLGAYPWSEKYGWVEDSFGVSWQLSLGKEGEVACKFSPYLTFTQSVFGKAEEAVHFYTSLFPDASVTSIFKVKEPGIQSESVMHAQFILCQQVFMAGDSSEGHAFQFGPGVSLVVSCENQSEIDHYWNNLTAGGHEQMCGWLVDRFGVSWQIVPSKIGTWMRDPKRGQRVAQAFMQMKKLDWEILECA